MANVVAPTMSLERLVFDLSDTEASDPRDKIYALLGIAADIDPGYPQFVPEYSKTSTDVYADFYKFCIGTSGSLDIILRPQSTQFPPPICSSELDHASMFTFLMRSKIQSPVFSRNQSKPEALIIFEGGLILLDGFEFGRIGADVQMKDVWSKARVAAAVLSGFRQEFGGEHLARFDSLVATLRQSRSSHDREALAAENVWADAIFGGFKDFRHCRKLVEADELPHLCLVPSEARLGN